MVGAVNDLVEEGGASFVGILSSTISSTVIVPSSCLVCGLLLVALFVVELLHLLILKERATAAAERYDFPGNIRLCDLLLRLICAQIEIVFTLGE